MFRELFTAASAKQSPAGIPPCPQARAMYAIDLLLQWRNNDKGSNPHCIHQPSGHSTLSTGPGNVCNRSTAAVEEQ